MDSINAQHIWTAIQIAGKILNDRVNRLVALIMGFSLFVWAIADPTWIRLAVAVAFAVTIFLPILWRTSKATLPGDPTNE